MSLIYKIIIISITTLLFFISCQNSVVSLNSLLISTIDVCDTKKCNILNNDDRIRKELVFSANFLNVDNEIDKIISEFFTLPENDLLIRELYNEVDIPEINYDNKRKYEYVILDTILNFGVYNDELNSYRNKNKTGIIFFIQPYIIRMSENEYYITGIKYRSKKVFCLFKRIDGGLKFLKFKTVNSNQIF